jgi:hypothetical protein
VTPRTRRIIVTSVLAGLIVVVLMSALLHWLA